MRQQDFLGIDLTVLTGGMGVICPRKNSIKEGGPFTLLLQSPHPATPLSAGATSEINGTVDICPGVQARKKRSAHG